MPRRHHYLRWNAQRVIQSHQLICTSKSKSARYLDWWKKLNCHPRVNHSSRLHRHIFLGQFPVKYDRYHDQLFDFYFGDVVIDSGKKKYQLLYSLQVPLCYPFFFAWYPKISPVQRVRFDRSPLRHCFHIWFGRVVSWYRIWCFWASEQGGIKNRGGGFETHPLWKKPYTSLAQDWTTRLWLNNR